MQHYGGLQAHQLGHDEEEGAADDKLLLVHGVYQWRFYWFGLCLQVAESFTPSCRTCTGLAESFSTSSNQLADSINLSVLA